MRIHVVCLRALWTALTPHRGVWSISKAVFQQKIGKERGVTIDEHLQCGSRVSNIGIALSAAPRVRGLAASLLALSLVSIAPGRALAAEFSLRFAHVLVADTPAGKAAERFAALVAERTKGRVEVKVYPAGQLGNDTQIVEQIQLNTVQIGIPPTAVLGQFEPRMQIFDLPFIFPTRAATYAVLDGDIGRELLGGLDKRGFVGLAFWESGFKQLTSRGKPITKPADLAGLKVRTMDSPLIVAQFRAWGSNPVPIAFGETYNALQQGVVDAQENPLVSIDRMKFYEVQDHLTLSNHAYLGYVLLVNKAAWTRLPEDLRPVIQKIAEETRDWQRAESEKLDAQLTEKMRASGMKVHTLDDAGRKEFIQVSRKVHQSYEKTLTKALLDRVYAQTEKLGN
jgi:C4-dicarboxylate-binding protein DctP